MATTRPRLDLEETSRLGDEIQDRLTRETLRPEDHGKYIAIDVISGEYEIDRSDYAAVTRLKARTIDAEIWLGCVGEPAAYRMRRGR